MFHCVCVSVWWACVSVWLRGADTEQAFLHYGPAQRHWVLLTSQASVCKSRKMWITSCGHSPSTERLLSAQCRHECALNANKPASQTAVNLSTVCRRWMIADRPFNKFAKRSFFYFLAACVYSFWSDKVKGGYLGLKEDDTKLKQICPYCYLQVNFKSTILFIGYKEYLVKVPQIKEESWIPQVFILLILIT